MKKITKIEEFEVGEIYKINMKFVNDDVELIVKCISNSILYNYKGQSSIQFETLMSNNIIWWCIGDKGSLYQFHLSIWDVEKFEFDEKNI